MARTHRPTAAAPITSPPSAGRVLLFRQHDEHVPRSVLAAVQAAVAERRLLVIDYVDRGGVSSVREVEPAGLIRGTDAWYLLGWCRLRRAGRAFRLDRITGATVGVERVAAHEVREVTPDVPAGFDALRLEA